MNNLLDIEKLTEEFKKMHYLPGLLQQKLERHKADNLIKTNELEAIYHLIESHVPGLRQKTVLRYEKILTSKDSHRSLSKSHVAFDCSTSNVNPKVDDLLRKIHEMPSEWTIVHITPSFHQQENVEISKEQNYTKSLYLSVFSCGIDRVKPFSVRVEAPKCSVDSSLMELVEEMYSILVENKNTLIAPKEIRRFKSVSDKMDYYSRRNMIDSRMKNLVKEMQTFYLREWRCLLVGKYINNILELKIRKQIEIFFENEAPELELNDKTINIIQCLIKNYNYLKVAEIRTLCRILPISDKNVQVKLAQFAKNVHNEMSLTEEEKHPLILIIDDTLDCFPWEMMDVLLDVPVSRLPSIHLLHALFHEHASTIEKGYKMVKNPQNGAFVLNPGKDLLKMEQRIKAFFEYWVPNWNGITRTEPSEDDFEKLLQSSDVFSYNGHGAGTQYISLQKIEKMRVGAVVLLFGCGSTKLVKEGPQVEMYGTYQTYLIACSPCVVGMLWEVTDLDTDILTTEILSNWIPNSQKPHWKYVDKTKWKTGDQSFFSNESGKIIPNEPDLLKVLNAARKSTSPSFYLTKAACVVRGLPVKIMQ